MTTAQAEKAFPVGTVVAVDPEGAFTYRVTGHWRGYLRAESVQIGTTCMLQPRDLAIMQPSPPATPSAA